MGVRSGTAFERLRLQRHQRDNPSKTMMKFSETDPTKAWWHDLEIPAGSQVLDLDHLTNVFMARSVNSKLPALKLGLSGNYLEGTKPVQFIGEAVEVIRQALIAGNKGDENVALFSGGEFYYDDPFPQETYYFFERGAVKLTTYNTHGDVELITDSPAILDAIRAGFNKILVESAAQGSVYMMTSTSRGPEFHSVGVGGLTLERANYAPEVLAAYDRIAEDVVAKTPRGRLSILDGPPGCGKTYLIRGLLNQVAGCLFVVVPPHFLPSLAEPSSLSAVTKLKEEHEKPIVFIVEDADECLATREEGNMSAISMVLNLGDGIIGSVLDVRIVATTNAKYASLDPAIKRPGRLTAFQTVGALPLEQAQAVYKRLTGVDADQQWQGATADPLGATKPIITKAMTLAEIYQLAYDAGWRGIKAPERKVGFGANKE